MNTQHSHHFYLYLKVNVEELRPGHLPVNLDVGNGQHESSCLSTWWHPNKFSCLMTSKTDSRCDV